MSKDLTVTGEWYTNQYYANCNTKGVIHLLECKKCKIQYMGHTTQQLKDREQEHTISVDNNDTSTLIGQDFSQCTNRGTRDLSVKAIEVK
ncbi:hypothetical protein XELAEV_18018386mg [Xenopus laevis]|uniref:Uncharacterized protein n=1 Tax=Xenopus laevis TaxID=8355 RepID=A0A974DDI5_XENLA|nr:hypothetical protein XELAEV_18018386mg [Xenopus laevis]